MDLKQIILTRERHTSFTSYFYVSSSSKGRNLKQSAGAPKLIYLLTENEKLWNVIRQRSLGAVN